MNFSFRAACSFGNSQRGRIIYGGKLIRRLWTICRCICSAFRRGVGRYQDEYYVKQFRCFDQFLTMAFAQLSYRESLHYIEICLQSHQNKLYHMGIRAPDVARGTLSKANERRDGRIYADFTQADPQGTSALHRIVFRYAPGY